MRKIGRVGRAVRRAVRAVARGVDFVTGDILDLDASKQKEQIEAMQRAEEQAQREAEMKKKAEKEYQQKVTSAKDKLNQQNAMQQDTSGVGLEGLEVDFTKNLQDKDDEDNLRKLLRKY